MKLVGARNSAFRRGYWLGRILEPSGFGYRSIVKDMVSECRITGDLGKSGIFPQKFSVATVILEDLWVHAVQSRRSLVESMRPSGDPEVDQDLYAQTLEEVAQGRAAGSFSEEELCSRLGPRWFAARRFGVKQGDKARCVDDFSEFVINMTVISREKAAAGGIYSILALARAWLAGRDSPNELVRFRLSDGSELSGTIHSDFKASRKLRRKCVDLASA